MGHATIYLPDEKRPLHEANERLMGKGDKSALPLYSYSDVVAQSKKSSWQQLKDYLPSVRDVVKLVLFFTVTVIGMTFIFEAFVNVAGNTKLQFGHNHENADNGMCSSNVHTASLSLGFSDPRKFAFTQLSEELPRSPNQLFDHVRTVGKVEVRNAVQNIGSYIQVDVEIRSSDVRLTSSELRVEKDDSTMVIKTPKQMPVGADSDRAAVPPCVNISAVISIAPGAKLENFGLDSETLSVIFHPGLEYAESRVVETKSQFKTMSTYSRETIIDVSSASVTGSFPLYDLLSIHTNSGSININVDPKNASTENVKPAVLRVTSNSGSVRANTATNSVPNRDYQTSMSSSSGSIDAAILHGLRTSLRSINGRVTADVYPYGHNDSRTDVEAHCTSGSMDITLHSSLSHPTAPLKKLYAYYRGISGSLTLFYPAQWQGTVEGTTASGGIDLDWEGLKVVKDGKEGWVKRTIEAIRGKGEGRLVFYSTSGRVTLSGEPGGL